MKEEKKNGEVGPRFTFGRKLKAGRGATSRHRSSASRQPLRPEYVSRGGGDQLTLAALFQVLPFLLLLLSSSLPPPPPPPLLHMLLLALTVSGSLGRHYIAMFEATQNVMLKPTESWREALLDTRVMDLFFTVSDPPRRRTPPPPTCLYCQTLL